MEKLKKEIEQSILNIEKQKPFVGIPEKDYYRGQWDALTWILDLIEGTHGKL